jgi:hypothetical protein
MHFSPFIAMSQISVVEIGAQDVEQLMNQQVSLQLARKNLMLLTRLRSCAFSEEFGQPDRFTASPAHTYYVAKSDEGPECLLKVKFDDTPKEGGGTLKRADLSLGRIADPAAQHGWQYLKAFIEHIMVPLSPFLVVARLNSKGGRRMFQDLETESSDHATAYTVLIAPAGATATGYVSNDPLTIECIRSVTNISRGKS